MTERKVKLYVAPMTTSQLRALRTSWGLRQIDMARLLRVTAETMNRYESGAYPFPQSRADYLRSLDGNPRLRAVLMKERGCGNG